MNCPKTIDKSNYQWVENVIGKPDTYYFKAKENVAKKWGINYVVNFGGCDPSDTKNNRDTTNNRAYFRELNKKFGKNWQADFLKEVELEREKLRNME